MSAPIPRIGCVEFPIPSWLNSEGVPVVAQGENVIKALRPLKNVYCCLARFIPPRFCL